MGQIIQEDILPEWEQLLSKSKERRTSGAPNLRSSHHLPPSSFPLLYRTIIKLGPPAALLKGFDIDTAWFSGNEAPAASVDGIYSPDAIPTKDSAVRPPPLPCELL